MKLRKIGLAICVMLFGSVTVAGSAWAQGQILTAESPFSVISRENSTRGTDGAFSMLAADRPQTLRVPGAQWLQLEFSAFNLGSSTLRIRDLDTGDVQTFTQAQLQAWEGRTAMFNSSRLRISVDLARNERQRPFYQLDEVRVGITERTNVNNFTICGTDNRVATTERRVGRLVPVGCTAWIVGNNLFLTAGHCVASGATTLQFNVPASLSNGQLVAPAVRDQYAVVQSSIVSRNGGIGNDWALFRVAANTQSGQLPRQAQGVQFSLSNNRTPTTLRIAGFGTDTGVTNQTNQVATGPFGAFSGTSTAARATYAVDTTGGNSGSPVALSGSSVAVAIHTNGGCTASGGVNSGTSFRNTTLWNAIRATGDAGLVLNP